MAHHYVRCPFRKGGAITHDYSAQHKARDIAPKTDDDGDVFAIESGIVTGYDDTQSGSTTDANMVVVRSAAGYLTVYAHVMPDVILGFNVKLGDKIGKVDTSGESTGRHVHLVRMPAQGGDNDDVDDVAARQDTAEYFTIHLKEWPAGELP